MGKSQLAKKCRKCPFADNCESKCMEALAYLPETATPIGNIASAPILRETVNTVIDGQVVKVYKEDIENELYKHLGVGLMQLGG